MNLQNVRNLLLSGLALTGLAATSTFVAPDTANAQNLRRQGGEYGYREYREREPMQRPAGVQQQPRVTPVFAVVSLNEQRISLYGTNGRVMQSGVSSGSTGYETPAGIFSIVQKKPQHNSNLYDDASMPFMQRITWTGIALHAGALPGYPASHGCVRLPLAFAEQLFDATKMGMRVILTRDDIVPQDFSHPALFKPQPLQANIEPITPRFARTARAELPISRIGAHAIDNVLTPSPTSEKYLGMLSALSSTKAAESERASRRALEAKQNAQRKAAEGAMAARNIKGAEANLARSEDAVKATAKALEVINAKPDAKPEAVKAAEVAKEKADARLVEARAQLETAKTQNQARIDAASVASDDARRADAARDAAADAAEDAIRRLSPVSVFVSRKMRRFYVRQANLPILEGPVAIRDADTTVGTYIYTALDFADGGVQDMRWSVMSMYKNASEVKAAPVETATKPAAAGATRRNVKTAESFPADVVGAKNALDRITLPEEARQRVAELLVPGSSLIISDEGPSIETGKDTDFVVVMSGEPQGALKMRKPQPKRDRDEGYGGGGGKPFFLFW